MKSSKRRGELVFLFLLLFILTLLITQLVMAIRQSQSNNSATVTNIDTASEKSAKKRLDD